LTAWLGVQETSTNVISNIITNASFDTLMRVVGKKGNPPGESNDLSLLDYGSIDPDVLFYNGFTSGDDLTCSLVTPIS